MDCAVEVFGFLLEVFEGGGLFFEEMDVATGVCEFAGFIFEFGVGVVEEGLFLLDLGAEIIV